MWPEEKEKETNVIGTKRYAWREGEVIRKRRVNALSKTVDCN